MIIVIEITVEVIKAGNGGDKCPAIYKKQYKSQRDDNES
jgi:hypothetical protein